MIFINTASNTTGLFKPFFPITLPYGIGFLMAILKQYKIYFNYVDQQLNSSPMLEINEFVKNHSKPYIFCISTLTESCFSAITLSKQLKTKYPDCITIMGGLHPSSMPEEVLSNENVDYVFMGEAESNIVEIYHKLKSGLSINDMRGIAFRKNGAVFINDAPELIMNLDSLPPFPYELFRKTKKYNFGHMISSRGCPYNCSFCCVKAVGKRKYRYKSAGNTVSELELLATDFKQKEIAFFDDNFLANKPRILELCEAIRKSKYLKNCTYSFQARSRDLTHDILQEMYASGFKTVFFGIETVSEKILKNIGKDETLEEIKTAIAVSKKIGFKVMANFIYCLPEETKAIRSDCVNFALENKIEVVKFNNVVPYPDTSLYEQTLKEKKLSVKPNYSNFNSQLVMVRPAWKKINFPYLPEGASSFSMRNEILFSYFKIYFNFHRLKKIFSDKNWGGAIFSFGNSNWDVVKKIPVIFLLVLDFTLKFSLMFISIFSAKGISARECLKVFYHFYKKI
jgi:anaerobic magnesium-protoporphyrin IX monomethyl ester cyclase